MDPKQRIQVVIQELQLITQQLSSLRNQIREIEGSIKLIEGQPNELKIFQQSGSILAEVSDRDATSSDLTNTKELLGSHVQRLTEKEVEIREEYESLIKEIEG